MKSRHIARIALFLACVLSLCDQGNGAAQATPYRTPKVRLPTYLVATFRKKTVASRGTLITALVMGDEHERQKDEF